MTDDDIRELITGLFNASPLIAGANALSKFGSNVQSGAQDFYNSMDNKIRNYWKPRAKPGDIVLPHESYSPTGRKKKRIVIDHDYS